MATGLLGCQLVTSESLASLSGGLLVYIGKCCRYPYLQFIFGVASSFVGLSFNHATNIKELQTEE